MKKRIAMALCVALVFSMAGMALAEMVKSAYLYCIVIEQTATTFTVLTDGQQRYTFQKGENLSVQSASGALAMDDAVVVQYTGTIEMNAEEQSVHVAEVVVLSTLDGTVHENSTMNAIWVQSLNDDGSAGPIYGFDKENADVAVGEDGILIGDDVEVAYRGSLEDLVEGQVQDVGYVHISVYGQIEDTME